MRVPRLFLSALALMLSTFSALANSIEFTEIETEKDWIAVFERARTENKLLFIDAYTDWCGPCKQLDKEVYTNDDVISYYEENFINVKYNAESEFGFQLARQMGVQGYPSLFFVTAEKEIFQKITGFLPAPALLAYGEQTLESFEVLPGLLEKYESLLITEEETMQLIGILERVDEEQAQTVARKHISQFITDDYKDIEVLWLLSRFENQINGEPYKYIVSHKDSMISWHGLEEYHDYMKAVYNDNLQLSIKYGNEELLNSLVTEVLKEFLQPYDIPQAAYVTKKLYYGERKEYSAFILEVNTYLNNQVSHKSKEQFLLETSVDILDTMEGDTMYQFAAELLAQAVGINEKNFPANALLGYANGLMGNFKVAIDQLENAKTLTTDAEELEMANGLLEAVNLMKAN